MRKLKRIADGKVYDCTIVEGRVSHAWDDARVRLKAVYYANGQWNAELLENNFVPAVQGKDY